MTHIRVCKIGRHWFRYWFVDCSALYLYLLQRWIIVDWIIGNKLKWMWNQNTTTFIQYKYSENVVWKIAVVLASNCYLRKSCNISWYLIGHVNNVYSLKYVLLNMFKFFLNCQWDMFFEGPVVSINQHWLWLFADYVNNYYYNQCWPWYLTPLTIKMVTSQITIFMERYIRRIEKGKISC